MRVQDLRADRNRLIASLPRHEVDTDATTDAVRTIIDDVRDRGVDAVLELSERLDGVRPPALRVPAEAITQAQTNLPPQVRAALEESIRRVRIVHSEQRPDEHVIQVAPGGTVAQRWVPVARVGMYVPGGQALYPTSVVMNVIPAQEAGVSSTAITSPPQKSNGGLPDPVVLGVAGLLGVDEVYAVGGAQAVAMFAFGLRDSSGKNICERVDMITGPGNLYVATAKRLLRGTVGIDSEAGPSEVMILADDTAFPSLVASDLISQAEHDTLAAGVLVTNSENLAAAVADSLACQIPETKHSERIRAALDGPQSAILLVRDLDDGLTIVNAYGAEHLEIQTRDAPALAARVRNAGAIFVGPYAPVALGDYCAGSNHVLPTGGSARHSSGLSVQSFLREIHVVDYNRDALAAVAGHVSVLAEAENLPAHGQAIAARFAPSVNQIPCQPIAGPRVPTPLLRTGDARETL